MRATAKEINEGFRPVELTLKFTTAKEVEAFFCVMNYTPISAAAAKAGVKLDVILDAINVINPYPREAFDYQNVWRTFVDDLERRMNR